MKWQTGSPPERVQPIQATVKKHLERFPALQRMLGRPSHAEKDLAAANQALEQRITELNASLAFLNKQGTGAWTKM